MDSPGFSNTSKRVALRTSALYGTKQEVCGVLSMCIVHSIHMSINVHVHYVPCMLKYVLVSVHTNLAVWEYPVEMVCS